MRRRRRGRGTALFAAVLLLLALLLAAFTQVGRWLVVSDPPIPSDVTFVTYGLNTHRPTLEQALRRLSDGESPLIVVGVFDQDPNDETLWPRPLDLTRAYLFSHGATPDQVSFLRPATSEYEEAQLFSAAVRARHWTRITAYTDAARSRRTRGTLRRFIPPGTDLRVVAIIWTGLELDRWWATRQGIDAVEHEVPRLAYYWLRGRLA